ncbi:MAG: hypothetical protein HKN08_00455 [Gammaproteobacteria bacterium]|nr:hypothetical protein [Gammaproteobacteria bacterium]
MIDINVVPAARGAAWFIQGFEYFRQSAGPWIGTAIIFLVINIALGMLPVAGMLISQLLTPVFIGGLILGCRDIDEGRGLQINHLFAGFSGHAGNLVLLGVLYTLGSVMIIILMAIVMFLTVGLEFIRILSEGGTEAVLQELSLEHIRNVLLVILTGLFFYVPLLMAFWFAPALTVLDKMGTVDAMKFSFSGCLKNIMPFLIYGIVGMMLSFLATLPFMLGWFIFTPMIMASIYHAYMDIYHPDQSVTIIQRS